MSFMNVKLQKEEKAELVRQVQQYFEEERSETIGDLAADQYLDFMLGILGPYIYNKALADAKAMVEQKFAQLEDDLYSFEKPTNHRRK